MIVFKTEMNEMPISCNYCVVRHICKPELNLSPRDTKQIVTFLEHCPLLEIPDPKPEPTLTQHEHDLIQIIKKVYPEAESIGITNTDDEIYLILNKQITVQYGYASKQQSNVKYKEKIYVDLFDKHKLPTLLSEFTNETSEKQYSINRLLSRPIRKEQK